ncbi:hypothetical protein ACPF8X_04765 [Streptomyces sp. G35A]
MVTATHEASHRLFQEHPEALAPVFEALGLPPPLKTDFHELSPTSPRSVRWNAARTRC